MAYIGNSPAFATQIVYRYTVSVAGTTITGMDDLGKALTYTRGYIAVYVNGSKLIETLDYTATTGSSIVFVNAVQIGDVVEIVAYGTYSLDALGPGNYVQKTGDTMSGVLSVRTAGDGLNIAGAATQGQIYAAGASADINLILSSRGEGSVILYNATFARMCAAFNSAPVSNTFVTFTGGPGYSSLQNNPADKPIYINSDVYLTQNSKLGRAGFSAYPTTYQSGVANETFTKVVFGSTTFNDATLYNTSLSRWVPPAGRCRVESQVWFGAVHTLYLGTAIMVSIYKNGTRYRDGTGICVSNQFAAASVNLIDNCNGTDYYEVYVFCYCSTAATILNGTMNTYFEGTML